MTLVGILSSDTDFSEIQEIKELSAQSFQTSKDLNELSAQLKDDINPRLVSLTTAIG